MVCGELFIPASDDRIFHFWDWENLKHDDEYHWTECLRDGEVDLLVREGN